MEWVETTTVDVVTRSFGFGANHLLLAVYCSDYLEVPLTAHVATPDAALDLTAEGSATATDADEGVTGPINVNLRGTFAFAVFPETDEDPADWVDTSTFVTLWFDNERALVEGSAGWEGQQPAAGAGHAEYVVRFSPAEPMPSR